MSKLCTNDFPELLKPFCKGEKDVNDFVSTKVNNSMHSVKFGALKMKMKSSKIITAPHPLQALLLTTILTRMSQK